MASDIATVTKGKLSETVSSSSFFFLLLLHHRLLKPTFHKSGGQSYTEALLLLILLLLLFSPLFAGLDEFERLRQDLLLKKQALQDRINSFQGLGAKKEDVSYMYTP